MASTRYPLPSISTVTRELLVLDMEDFCPLYRSVSYGQLYKNLLGSSKAYYAASNCCCFHTTVMIVCDTEAFLQKSRISESRDQLQRWETKNGNTSVVRKFSVGAPEQIISDICMKSARIYQEVLGLIFPLWSDEVNERASVFHLKRFSGLIWILRPAIFTSRPGCIAGIGVDVCSSNGGWNGQQLHKGR